MVIENNFSDKSLTDSNVRPLNTQDLHQDFFEFKDIKDERPPFEMDRFEIEEIVDKINRK